MDAEAQATLELINATQAELNPTLATWCEDNGIAQEGIYMAADQGILACCMFGSVSLTEIGRVLFDGGIKVGYALAQKKAES